MLAIDTLKLSEDLKKGGFDEKQTETLVELGRTLSDQALEKVATKDDLKALEDRMDLKFDGLRKDVTAEIDGLRKDVKVKSDGLRKEITAEMKLLEQRMVIKLGGMLAIGIGVLLMFDRLFPATPVAG